VSKRKLEAFVEQEPAAGESPRQSLDEVVFTPEMAMQLRVLWDDYTQRMRVAEAPTTTSYRCLGFKQDGTPCGAVVEAGTRERRVQTGETVRCPHGPDAPLEGVRFDRERFPQYHVELTPMEEIG